MKSHLPLLLVMFLVSCGDEVDFQILKAQSKGSSDSGHFEFVKYVSFEVDGQKCADKVRQYKAIKVFSGNLKPGDTIEAWGNVDSIDNMEGERILLMKNYSPSPEVEYDKCTMHMFKNYRAIHSWCCGINTDNKTGNKFVLFYKMINSEQRGPDIPVKLEKVYQALE
jgi:hypothetical protein